MVFLKGNVSGIMGNRFCDFGPGDLILMGPNFPHVIFEAKRPSGPNIKPFGIVIQFKRDFLGKAFLEAPELAPIKKLIDKSENGVRFSKRILQKNKELIIGISKRPNTRQLFDLLELLHILASSDETEKLSPEGSHHFSASDEKRMEIIREYLREHFREDISVKEMASMINMTVTSFCRFYKNRTLKHFKQTLNEMRISHACELLGKGSTVQEACYRSGFNNPAYFSRTFKRIVGANPSSYKSHSALKVVRW